MIAFVTAGGGFLLAVLWFDLMFDVQVLGHREDELPESSLSSIAAYYARVTTAARPMNRLIATVMLATIAAVVAEIVDGRRPHRGRVGLARARRRAGGARRRAHCAERRAPRRPPRLARAPERARAVDLPRAPALLRVDRSADRAAARRCLSWPRDAQYCSLRGYHSSRKRKRLRPAALDVDRGRRRGLRRGRSRHDVAARGLRRRDGLRARRAGRRCVEPQHLSRRRLRRPLAPVRVLLRAERPLVAPLRAAGGDPGLPRGRRAAQRGAGPDPHQHRGDERALGRAARQVAAADERGRARGRRPDHRVRPAVGRQAAHDPRPGELRRSGLPHLAVAPRRRAGGQARGRDRHRLQRDPGRAGDPAAGRAGRRLPALAGLDDPEDGLRLLPAHAAPVRALPRPCSASIGWRCSRSWRPARRP